MRITDWTIGSDPEVFIEKNGKIISAEGIIGGTKTEPKSISEYGHYIQEDNVMAEFNIPPCNNTEEFIYNINFVKDYLTEMLSFNKMKLNYTTSSKFTKKELSTPQARMFGCDPSFNVYLKDISPVPSAKSEWRSCGGHLHIGYNNPDQETTEQIVYGMDMILGLKSVLIDEDTVRKQSYGKAGEFRFKEFGVEWRTLSNFWIKNDELINWVYESTSLVIEMINSEIMDDLIEKYSNQVRDAIDNSNKELAESLLQTIDKEYKEFKNKELVLN